jgi:hypothetical protein
MLRKLKTWGRGAKVTTNLLQVKRVQRPSAFITLISSSLRKVAMRTYALHIAVRQKTPALGAIGLKHFVSIEVTLVEQRKKDVMGDLSMIVGARSREQVKRNAQLLPIPKKLLLVFGHYFLWCGAFLLRPNCDWRPMLIAARNHQYVVTSKALVTGEDVCRQISSSDVPQMKRPISIRPGNAYQNTLTQRSLKTGLWERR